MFRKILEIEEKSTLPDSCCVIFNDFENLILVGGQVSFGTFGPISGVILTIS